jgi:hypothetical protein
MVVGIFSFLAFLGGVLLVIAGGIGLFYFARAIFPPFGSSGAEGGGRRPPDRDRRDPDSSPEGGR